MTEDQIKELQARIPDGYWKGIDIDEGWHDLVWQLHQDLVALDPEYTLSQVKEKFGGLRYYANASNAYHIEATSDGEKWFDSDFIRRIGEAEAESYRTCEKCGQPGFLRDTRWLRTLCDEHSEGAGPHPQAKMFTGEALDSDPS